MFKDKYDQPIGCFCEENGFQQFFKNQAIKDALVLDQQVPTSGVLNTKNKIARIKAMEPFVSNSLLLFRQDWQQAPEGYKLLLEQLKSFPSSKTNVDAPDALQGAFSKAQSRLWSGRNRTPEKKEEA